MKHVFILTTAFFISLSLIAQQKVTDGDLLELKNRMVGAFSSELQSKSDTDYFNIHLHMAQIWVDSKDGYWLYVEQAVARALSKPYRQRIYHVYKQDDVTLVSKVFEINTPIRFAGAWNNTGLLKVLTTDSLIDRQGCSIYLHKDKDGNFAGATPGKECLSSLRGSTYATSEVVIYADKLVSWDRGWDKEDKQVWGAEKGGYQFIKQKE
ncbi:MAG: chromophore lyase CpcT/CpeT [Chitinophagaceae bacterium]|nr:chromophore lyase CpcT/CpeT [Chitinophagaceae bacterium]